MSYYDSHDHHGYATTDDLDDLRRQLDQVRYDADQATARRAIRGQIPGRRGSLRQLHVAYSHVAHDVAAPTLRGR